MDDSALLEGVRAGDESAFTALVERYHPTLVRLARYYVASAAQAEDVAQDTWLAVLRGVDRFENRSSFKTWLLRICVNRARTAGARERRSVSVVIDAAEPAVEPARFNAGGMWSAPPTSFTDFVEQAQSDEPLVAAVRAAIAELVDPYLAVVTLRDVEGLTTTEVANLLGLSVANVRVILHRARSRVRAAVEHTMDGGGR